MNQLPSPIVYDTGMSDIQAPVYVTSDGTVYATSDGTVYTTSDGTVVHPTLMCRWGNFTSAGHVVELTSFYTDGTRVTIRFRVGMGEVNRVLSRDEYLFYINSEV